MVTGRGDRSIDKADHALEAPQRTPHQLQGGDGRRHRAAEGIEGLGGVEERRVGLGRARAPLVSPDSRRLGHQTRRTKAVGWFRTVPNPFRTLRPDEQGQAGELGAQWGIG